MVYRIENLISIVVPIIVFVIYGLLYKVLVDISRFILLFSENQILFYSLLFIANLIAVIISYFIIKRIEKDNGTPLKIYIKSILVLMTFVGLKMLSQFSVSEVLITFEESGFESYNQYYGSQNWVWGIFNILLILCIGFRLASNSKKSTSAN